MDSIKLTGTVFEPYMSFFLKLLKHFACVFPCVLHTPPILVSFSWSPKQYYVKNVNNVVSPYVLFEFRLYSIPIFPYNESRRNRGRRSSHSTRDSFQYLHSRHMQKQDTLYIISFLRYICPYFIQQSY
jgi:hypothetical protein